MRVLIACEESGVVRDAYLDAGFDATSCDLLPSRSAKGPHIQGDVRDILGDGWDLMIAHPPCTRLTNSGVRWLNSPPPGKTKQQMWNDLYEAAIFYKTLRDAPIPKKAIENPVMHCHARNLIQPGKRQIVQPWWFGDPYFKATGFELIGLLPLVATNRLTPPNKGSEEHKAWSAVHRASPGPSRARDRSVSFRGMAKAMPEQWDG